MVKSAMMVAIRARAKARGMTLADLARAAGMEPSNLRRMLTSSTANPRLDSVMRLLGPLGAAIGARGARSPGEVIASLDAARRRRGASWRSLLADHGRNPAAIERRLKSDPGSLAIDVVMRIAEGLEVELSLVDATVKAAPASATPHPDEPRDAPAQPRSRRRATTPDTGRSTVAPTPAPASTPATVESPARAAPAWPPPLRPPRLGRYRDAPPQPPRPPVSSSLADVAGPRTSAPPYPLERAILGKLADVSAATWRRIYRWFGARLFGHRDAPVELLDEVAAHTAEGLGRLRVPTPPEEPVAAPGAWTMIDPALLVAPWRRFKESGLPSEDIIVDVDAAGRQIVVHHCLDRRFALVVTPSDERGPATLTTLLHTEPKLGGRSVEVPLAVKIDGDLRPFAYLPAGVVLGELNCGEVGYLLAGISDHLAIVELTRSGRRVVWYGRAEALSEVDLPRAQDLSEATPSATPSTPPASDPAAGQDDLSAQAEQKIGELQQQLAALAADHSATKVQLQVEQTERAQADARLGEVTNLEHLMAVMMAIMASSLSLDEDDAAADEVEGAAAALPLAITEAPIAADHRQDVEDLRRRNAALSDEIEALRAAAAERAATLEEETARLAGERAAVRAAAEPTAPPGVEAPDDHEEHPACAPLADARAHPEDEAEDRAALAEELRAARQELAEERDARLAAAQGAQRAEQLLAERTAALAEIEAARDSLTAELARARDEAAVTLAEARDQLADERLAHATTVEHADELRRRLAVAEAELTATREALAGAEASAHPITDQSSDDEPHLAEDTRPASGVTPAEAEQLLAALAELDPERLPDYQRLVASPDMPLISRITKAMFQVLVGEAQEDMTALRQRLEKAERAVARAERNAPRHPFKGRKKKTRR